MDISKRRQVWSWTGSVGSALTVLSTLKKIVGLAPFAYWLVTSWQQLTHAIWDAVFSWLSFRLPSEIKDVLTAMAIMTALVVRTIYDSVQTEPAEPGPTLRRVLTGAAFIILAWVALTVLLALLRLLLIPAETWTGGKFGPIVFLLIVGVVTPFTLFIMLHVAVIPARLYKALTDKEPYGFEFVCLRALVLVGVTLVLSWLHLLAK